MMMITSSITVLKRLIIFGRLKLPNLFFFLFLFVRLDEFSNFTVKNHLGNSLKIQLQGHTFNFDLVGPIIRPRDYHFKQHNRKL